MIREDRQIWTFKGVVIPKTEDVITFGNCPIYYFRRVCVDLDSQDLPWKNDITAAWQKLYSASDSVVFKLYKEGGELSNYTVSSLSFPTDTKSKYCQINWLDVFLADGGIESNYRLVLEVTVSGNMIEKEWGKYSLTTWDAKELNNSVLIRSRFNGRMEHENLDFSNTNCWDSVRFAGILGDQKPNSVDDTIISYDGVLRNAVSYNMYTYTLKSLNENDPKFIKFIMDHHLIGSAEMYVTSIYALSSLPNQVELPLVCDKRDIGTVGGSRNISINIELKDKVHNIINYR
ncbi:MAG: hypothetical protein VKN72_11840 [Nostocales cyanobacterium 94392]|nr:hypothetical protein [Nostocales cyanobacterium 94392]